MAIKHAKTSGKPAPIDTSLVGGPDWDANHTVTGTANALQKVSGTTLADSLIIDDGTTVTTPNLSIATGAGQAALCSTKRAASTEGFSVCIGGGGQSVVYDGSNAQTGSRNTGLGINALAADTTGYANTAVGAFTLAANTTGHDNVAVGVRALQANTTGFESVAIGQDALAAQIGGSSNVAVGGTALQHMVNAGNNTAIGTTALQALVSGDNNTAVGDQAMLTPTNTTNNVAVGANALAGLTTGYQNTAIGVQADQIDSAGIANTCVGAFATQLCTGGIGNTSVGASVAPNLTTGQYNTIIGGLGGGGITTGNNNTVIGANVTGLAGALSNNIILADGAGNIRYQADANGNAALAKHVQITGGALSLASVITPSQLTNGSTNNDYNPTNLATAARINQDVNTAATVTGLTAPATFAEGRIVTFHNISTTGAITFTHQGAGSAAANRFTLPGGSSLVLGNRDTVSFVYDLANTTWRVFK